MFIKAVRIMLSGRTSKYFIIPIIFAELKLHQLNFTEQVYECPKFIIEHNKRESWSLL